MLAARFLLALFPPNTPMFRLRVNDQKLQEAQEAARAKGGEGEDWETEIQKALSMYEQRVQAEIEGCGDRPVVHDGLNHLLVAGNVLFFDSLKDGRPLRIFPLTRYAVSRDPMGVWIELVIHERVSLRALPEDVKTRILANLAQAAEGRNSTDQYVDVYTHVVRENDKYVAYQECEGGRVDGTDAEYPLDGCPYIPLRMFQVAGEDYGRSYVENYLGDLKSLEALTQAVLEGSAISSKIVFLVAPNGITKAIDLQRTANGGFATGNAADITTLQVQKSPDLRVAFEAMQMLTSHLSKAFMLMDGIRRDAERVTAEEIRLMAEQMEAGYGGLYSLLSQEFQQPYIRRKIHKLVKSGKLEKLPNDDVTLSITTGFEALGRGSDRAKLISFIETLAQHLGPQALQQYLNVPDFIAKLAAADGISTSGLIKDKAQLEQEQQQAQQQQAMESLGPEAIKAVGGALQGGGGGQGAVQPEELQGEMNA